GDLRALLARREIQARELAQPVRLDLARRPGRAAPRACEPLPLARVQTGRTGTGARADFQEPGAETLQRGARRAPRPARSGRRGSRLAGLRSLGVGLLRQAALDLDHELEQVVELEQGEIDPLHAGIDEARARVLEGLRKLPEQERQGLLASFER